MNRHRTTTAILAVIAFLLAAHLAVMLSGTEAHAQSPDQPGPPTEPQEPHIVSISAPDYGTVVRLWSDGVIERNLYNGSGPNSPGGGCGGWCGWRVVPE